MFEYFCDPGSFTIIGCLKSIKIKQKIKTMLNFFASSLAWSVVALELFICLYKKMQSFNIWASLIFHTIT